MDNQVWRTVPLKLFPVNELQYTIEWAKNTYNYRVLFDSTVNAQNYKNDNELQDWRIQGLQIMKEIKKIGIAYGRQEIVNLARSHYGMTMSQCGNAKPSNLDDVMAIIEDEKWYNENKVYKQNIIYHMMYGLTRSGMNGWLLQQEHKWMQDHNIQYSQEETGIRKTKLRGFVYSIMNSQFSNSTIKLFHTVMQQKYHEFITVRKPMEPISPSLTYTARNFLGGNGYIVTCLTKNDFLNITNTPNIKTMGETWVQQCRTKYNMTVHEIHTLVDQLCTEAHIQDTITVSNGSDVSSEIQDSPQIPKQHNSVGSI